MSIKSLLKKWFGKSEETIETIIETKVEPIVKNVVKAEIAKIDVDKATKEIENRLAEIATEKKLTAKEIKAKVKKTPEIVVEKPVKTVKSKPAKTKATAEKKTENKPVSKPRKKAEPKK